MSNISFTLESNTDDNFFGNLERKHSTLGQLFGIGTNQVNDGQTLKYQPTKPQIGIALANLTTTSLKIWNTQLAKVARAYKAGEILGIVGVALLTNSTENAYKIIVYKTKTNVLATCSLNLSKSSVQLRRQSRYLQFYDDEQIYWSLRFDREADEYEFIAKLQELNVIIIQKPTENIVETATAVNAEEPIETSVLKTFTQTGNKLDSPIFQKDTHSTALITRMAKIGQQVPKLTTLSLSSNECSDSSDIDASSLPINSDKPLIIPRSSKLQTKTQTQVVAANNVGMHNETGAIANTNAIETQFLQMMLTENRTQNTEMRMNMNKLEGKIEKVLGRFEHFNTGSHQKSNKEDEILALEEKLLNLKKENRKLKQSLERRDQSSDLKVADHVLENYKDDLNAIGMLPNNNLNIIINNLIERSKKLHNNLELYESELARKSKELIESKTKLCEEKAKNSDALKQIIELENINTTLQIKLENKEQGNLQLRMNDQTLLTKQASDAETMIKQIMNGLYGNLSVKIENVDKLDKNFIIALIGKTIREETLKGIEQIKK